MAQRLTRRAAFAGLGAVVLVIGGRATAQYPYPPQGGPYGGPRPGDGDRRGEEYEHRRREEERDRGRGEEDQRGRYGQEQQYNRGLLALQQQRNQRVLSLQQQFNAGRITRGQLMEGTRGADEDLSRQTGR